MATKNLENTSTTNTKEGSVCQLNAQCDTMWSLAQQFAYVRLSETPNFIQRQFLKPGAKLLPDRSIFKDYAQRARIISATYARFYLELEEHGTPKKKGRYYWMALGAFASKTVACTLDMVRVNAGKFLPTPHPDFDFSYVRDGLGKGNFWLFQDIAPTHWYYNYSPSTFEVCKNSRGIKGYNKIVSESLQRLPWSDTALPTLEWMPLSSHIKNAFALIPKIDSSVGIKRADAQFDHLMAIAKHEQGVILQPLMYKDQKFAHWVQRQRGWLSWFSPNLELVFNHVCETDEALKKSVAPEDTVLENYESRMNWITMAAKQFHGLMQNQKDYMEVELKTMAGWNSGGD